MVSDTTPTEKLRKEKEVNFMKLANYMYIDMIVGFLFG